MRRRSARAFVALASVACVAVAARPAAGQAPQDDSISRGGIDGYGGVPWGADSTSIVREMGRPDTARSVETLNAKALVYAGHQLGRTLGSLGFLVRSDEGLVRVLYLTEYGTGGRCLDMYQSVRDSVAAMMPDIARQERMYNDAEDLPFCTAFQLGQAGARSIWRDSASGTRAWVALDLETGVVRASFESSRFGPTLGGGR